MIVFHSSMFLLAFLECLVDSGRNNQRSLKMRENAIVDITKVNAVYSLGHNVQVHL